LTQIQLSAGAETVNDLVLDIPAVEANKFENIGTTVEVALNGTLEQGGASRTLKQMHFHTPSEHRIDNEVRWTAGAQKRLTMTQYFGAESHMVFEDEAGSITVLSVLYTLDASTATPAISDVLAKVADIVRPNLCP
jgi:carbonic anhydrase